MTQEDTNRSVIESYIATWNDRDLDKLSSYWDPSIVHHTRSSAHDFENTKGIIAAFVAQFPDSRFEIHDIVAEGDRVATRMTWRATHQGSYLGAAQSERKIACTVIDIARLSGGKIVEHWGVTDELSMMAQLGMVPPELLTGMG